MQPTDAGARSLSSRVVTRFDELSALHADWSRLLEESASNVPTLSPAWLLPWWEVFGSTGRRELRAVLIHQGERLVGLAPLLVRPVRDRLGLPFLALEGLGSGEDEADEICSDYIGIVAAAGMESAVAGEVASVLAGGALGAWDELSLPAMNGDSSLPMHLGAALEERGLLVHTTVTGLSHYVPLPGSWEAYLEALSASHRYMVRRALRDFDRWAGPSLVVERATDAESLARGMTILETLHAERWKEAGHGGAFVSERFRAFHSKVAAALLARGALELVWMSAHGEPVAIAYNVRWDGRVQFYQSGRSLRVPHGVRPGIALHAAQIRAAIERGDREYDFLPGESRYKAALGLESRPIVHLCAARPSVGHLAREVSALALDQLRAFRRSRAKRADAPCDARDRL